MTRQLTFDLGAKTALGREDFFVSSANALALKVIEADADWPQGKLVLTGPHGAGKTHLAHVWAAISGAVFLNGHDLPQGLSEGLPEARAVIVENAHLTPPESEATLFHIHNHVLAQKGRLLMTAPEAPSRWPIGLPDLASRFQATQVTTIEAPDDALLSAVLVKQLADRQLMPDPTVIQFILTRIERSFGAVAKVVAALDAQGLAQGRPITRPLAAQVLSDLDHT